MAPQRNGSTPQRRLPLPRPPPPPPPLPPPIPTRLQTIGALALACRRRTRDGTLVPTKALDNRRSHAASVRVRARHEAGHCVVAIAMGWRVRSLDIADDIGRCGAADYFFRPSYCSYRSTDRRRRLSVLFAGVEAERRVSRASVFSLLTGAGAADAEKIRETLDESYGPWADAPPPFRHRRDQEEEDSRRLAREVLRRHWRAVERLTRALVRQGRLSGTDSFDLAVRASPQLRIEFLRARRDKSQSD